MSRPFAPTPYIIFCKQKRAAVQAANPNATFGQMGVILGTIWRQMSEEEKTPYVKASDEAKQYYKKIY